MVMISVRCSIFSSSALKMKTRSSFGTGKTSVLSFKMGVISGSNSGLKTFLKQALVWFLIKSSVLSANEYFCPSADSSCSNFVYALTVKIAGVFADKLQAFK